VYLSRHFRHGLKENTSAISLTPVTPLRFAVLSSGCAA
jgi:hypothetical protein